MVVARLVEVLLVVLVVPVVVLRQRHLEVRDPGQLPVNVPLLPAERRPGRHAGPADRVLLVGVQGLLGTVRDHGLLLVLFVEVLLFLLLVRGYYLVEDVVGVVESRGRHVVTFVPIFFSSILMLWSKSTIHL